MVPSVLTRIKAENKRSPKRTGKLLPIMACEYIRKAATLLVDSAVIRNRAEQRRKESNRALLRRLDSNGAEKNAHMDDSRLNGPKERYHNTFSNRSAVKYCDFISTSGSPQELRTGAQADDLS